MNKKELLKYEEDERQLIRSRGFAAIEDGFIKHPEMIYPDLELPSLRALHRGKAPLSLACFLYPKTFVFIPPTSVKELEVRFGGLAYEELVKLAQLKIVQPIIGHPVYYAGKNHLGAIMELHPPSIWARGTELIMPIGGQAYFEEAEHTIDLNAAVNLGWVRSKWQRHYPKLDEHELTERIKVELTTNYVDLCALGYRDALDEVFSSPVIRVQIERLLTLNQLIAYPKLMAADGTACYGTGDFPPINMIRAERVDNKTVILNEVHAHLLRRLELEFPSQFTAEQLAEFHNDAASTRLWEVIKLLEEDLQDPDSEIDVLARYADQASAIIDEALDEFVPRRQRFRKLVEKKAVPWAFRLGGVATGLIAWTQGGIPGLIQGLAAGGGLGELAHRGAEEVELERWLAMHLSNMRFGPLTTNLAWLKKKSKDLREVQENAQL